MKDSFQCVIVDDEPLAIELMQAHIQQIPQLDLVYTTGNPIDALQYLKSNNFDLLFIDIQMPVLTGLDLVRTLKDTSGVIFTTAYREYAVESYDLNVVDYLVKPITFIRFLKAVNKYLDTKKIQAPEIGSITKEETSTIASSIYVNVNKRYVKVVFEDIDYVESVKDYIHIHIGDEAIVTKDKLSDFVLKLPSEFIRIHRSFVVNRRKITAFTAQDVEIGKKELPIGQNYKADILSILK